MEDNIKYLKRHKEELGSTKAVITPICIVVDASKSMILFKENGLTRMDRLNEGIQQFLHEIKKDDMLADSVEISVVLFENDAELYQNFSTVENIESIYLYAKNGSGDTPKGVELALKVLEKEKDFLKQSKSKYNQPWIVIFSDGRATPGPDAIDASGKKDFRDITRRLKIAQDKVKALESSGKLTVIPVLISEKSDKQYKEAHSQMRGFSAKDRVLVLGNDEDSVSFKDFFKILSKSVSVSNADLLFRKDFSTNGQLGTEQRKIQRNVESTSGANQNNVSPIIEQSKTQKVEITIMLNQELELQQSLVVQYWENGKRCCVSTENNISIIGSVAVLSIDVEESLSELKLNVSLMSDQNQSIVLFDERCDISQNKIFLDLRDEIEFQPEQASTDTQEIETQIQEEQIEAFQIEAAQSHQTTAGNNEVDTTTDEYLNSLLEGLSDWDDI